MSYWKMSIRSSQFYDSSNPRDWSFDASIPDGQELRPDYIQDNWDDNKNKVFTGNTPLDYTGNIDTDILETSDLQTPLLAKELIVYSSARTVPQLGKVYNFYKKVT